VGVVAVAARRADVLGPDARPLLDDVDHRHAVTPAQLVVVLEPGEDLGGLDGGVVVAALLRLLEQLARCEPGLLLDRVEVGLERHRGVLSSSRVPIGTDGYGTVRYPRWSTGRRSACGQRPAPA